MRMTSPDSECTTTSRRPNADCPIRTSRSWPGEEWIGSGIVIDKDLGKRWTLPRRIRRASFRSAPPSSCAIRTKFPLQLEGRSPRSLQRNISVLLGRIHVALGFEHPERGDEFGAGVAGLDHVVDGAAPGGNLRVGEAVAERLDLLPAQFFGVFGLLQLAPVDNIDG